MTYQHWRIEDLPWDSLNSAQVGGDLLSVIKAAALVEYNADAYADYLCNVFSDDPVFQNDARAWAIEEVQHGKALGLWAEKVDPSWNLETAMARFRAGYKVEHFTANVSASVRGSRAGELVARCMVETGTSSYYTAIGNSCAEPVLKEICKKIAGDEFRHYKLFYDHLHGYLEKDRLGKLGRLKVALGRLAEGEDDELAFAYYAANAAEDAPYDREVYSRAYLSRAYSYYKKPEVDRAVSMIFKACGFKPQTIAYKIAARIAWWKFESDARAVQKIAA
jgi:hypothetical protein